ncbi:unnamed protein product [Tilletia controversa]|uniref:DUF605-domain-containing protein n=3 Tax=Tilletia TaxID=13289 RepID=A0A8X7MYG6_9BASI|nr:hypothetical protein CF336_g753 [Tilletia laevis]KAE8203172.1 hypothetical protein CF328_g1793 [Tilletia controversa]KAE8265205.1 hypothetical protein A4X03_0g428 [Tilletia caries]KAE8208436.1 hypothetical protein CF335_g418 [Tilletia laevis]KAE8253460.1 hypothetical protein A4X06_0g1433 [Tilletia controversa]
MALPSSAAGPGAGLLPTTAELKVLTPFMQRAHELRTADPPMAYWCSLYAAQLGIGAKSTERESKLFLGRLMDDLEAQKQTLGASDVITNETASAAYVENFALKVFTAADNQDRAGQATRATARNFLVASQFLEVLDVFGALDPEIAEKIKYAKWKAADIAKAFKEGRTPVAGPPGGEENEAMAVTTPGDTVVDSPAFLPSVDSASAIAPPPFERASSFSSSVGGGSNQPDASSRARARLSIHAASSQSPNFSMPLPAPPKTNALEAEVAAQQAELARLGLAPPDWRGSAFAALASTSPSGSTGRPLPMPPQGAPGRDGLPVPPSGLPFLVGSPSVPGSTTSFSANTSPHLGGTTPLSSGFLPSTPTYISGTEAPPPSAPLPPSSPSPYPYHHQPPTRQFTQGNGPLPHPPPLAPSPAMAPAPSAPPLPLTASPTALAAPPSAPSAFPESLTSTQTAKAQKLAKWAISSLDYDDLATSAKHLREALDIIEGRTK